MIHSINTQIRQLAVHYVGNKSLEEGIEFSESVMEQPDDATIEALLKYFLSSIKGEELFEFYHESDLELNELFSFCTKIFKDKRNFFGQGKNIAKHLYECSEHPKIKSGEFYVAYFTDLVLDDESFDAIGLFKSESKDRFLKVKQKNKIFNVSSEEGINTNKLDKGCLIFNTDETTGFKIAIVDNLNKSLEAQYWKDDFLKVKPVNNDFHMTKEFLGIAKNFVVKQLSEDFEVSKSDQIDLLNRSVEYFKENDSFDKKDFEKKVFQEPEIIKSFRSYDTSYREDNDLEIEDQFEISKPAVKKQSKVFKSVLKLDKNFHIYIHGNKDMIERGVEKDGRKFYKIYFESEM